MDENIFCDLSRLALRGSNVIIGRTVHFRYPELVAIGDNCIIDDFCYISSALELAGFVHISAGCKIIGGPKSRLVMDRFSTLSPNVVVAAGSDDYSGGIATPLVPAKYKGKVEYGKVTIRKHVIVGAGTVILPNVTLAEGAAVGALSLVKADVPEWELYAGVPARRLRDRRKDETLALESLFEESA